MNTRPSEVVPTLEPAEQEEAGPGNREVRHVFDVLPGGSGSRAPADPVSESLSAVAPERSNPNSNKGWIAIVIALAAVAAVGFWWSLQRDQAAPLAEAPTAAEAASAAPMPSAGGAAALTVSLLTPQVISWPETIVASGPIEAWQEAMVSVEVSGLRIKEVNVDVGDEVTQGQVLARLDDSMMLAAVAQQRAMVEEAQARLAEASANAHRAQRLRQSAAISEQDLIQFVTRAHAAQAELKSAQARLQSSELNLKFTTVTAPDAGVISSRHAMLGAVAGPGAELFRLVRQNRLEWRAELTGAQLGRVSVEQRAELKLPDGSTAVGTVRQLAPVLDEKTRTAIAYIELDRAQSPSARAGMYASGVLIAKETPGIAVPASAVVLRDGHQYVLRVDAEQRVQQVKVQTGRRQGDLVEITAGLTAEQSVIGTGAAFLNNGDPVRVTHSQAVATQTSQG